MKYTLTAFIFLFSISLFAQAPLQKFTGRLQYSESNTPNTEKLLVWVFFTDKGPNIERYYQNPLLVVSEKSLKRREKVVGNKPLIGFTDLPVYQNYIQQVQSTGFKINQRTRWFNGISGYATKEMLLQIADFNFVKKLDVVQKYKINNTESKTYTKAQVESMSHHLYKQDETHSLNYGPSYTQDEQINIPALHDMGYSGAGITICSMDAGFSLLSHEAFDSLHIIAEWDFVNHDSTVWNVPGDSGDGSHGTETLSTIGGYSPGELIGPAYGANFILAKTENTDSETPIEEDNWVAAVEWADSIGVDVTTTSLGYLTFDPPWPSLTWQDMDGNTAIITIAADLAVSWGIVVVNSAGNNGYNSQHNTLNAPADGDSVIAVGSVDDAGNRSSFSSVGPTVDGRIKPDVMAMGEFDYVASPYDPHGYTYGDGTSFSCPLAAGVAALILQYNPNLTPIQVREAMRMTASNSSNPNNQMGWGILNAVDAAQYFPLPVELTSFTAIYFDGRVTLDWTTASETNNHGFEIQRKIGDSDFKSIGFVNGSGSSTQSHSYEYIDKNPVTGKISYRLKQVDFNGGFTYSKVVDVSIYNPKNFKLYQNYPNPFNPTTTISYSLPKVSNIKLAVYDILGRELEVLANGKESEGIHNISFNASNLSSGIYILNLSADGFHKSIKMTLLK